MTDLVFLSTYFGLELLTWVSIGLGLLGVFGSAVPIIPGSLLALSGVYLHWWSTGYTEPGLIGMSILTVLGLMIIAIDWLGGALSAKVSGASNTTTFLAGIAGFLLFFVAGPIGILCGIAGTVFLSELYRTENKHRSAKTAIYTTIAMLASTVAQVLLTLLLFLGHLFFIFV